jgi:hypothetical protein
MDLLDDRPTPLMARRLQALSLLASLACAGESGPAPSFDDDPITVTPTSQWAGGKVVLESETFGAFAQDSALVTIDTFSVTAVRLDGSHFELVLPPRIQGGIHTLALEIGSSSGGAEVTVAGIVGEDLIAEFLDDVAPQPWPWNAPTGLLGKRVDDTPVYVDARTGAVAVFSTIRSLGSYTPGTSYRPSIALVQDTTGLALFDLDLEAGSATLDTAPQIGFTRQVYELAAGQWLVTGNHSTGLVGDDGTFLHPMESPWYFVRSPAGGVGTFIVNETHLGGVYQLPIVDLATKRVLLHVAGVGTTDAAAWSVDGSSLYLAAHAKSLVPPSSRSLSTTPVPPSRCSFRTPPPGSST